MYSAVHPTNDAGRQTKTVIVVGDNDFVGDGVASVEDGGRVNDLFGESVL